MMRIKLGEVYKLILTNVIYDNEFALSMWAVCWTLTL